MSRIYQYQTYLRIELTTGINLTGALDTEIRYSKPSGTTGALQATVDGDPADGVIIYDLLADSSGGSDFLDETGIWKFWAWVMASDGREAPGDTIKIRVYAEGA